MICIIDKQNKIINIVNAPYPTAENERVYYPWCALWEQYTEQEPLEYARQRYLNMVGAEFANKRDAIRKINITGKTYGFDCASEDIVNFMASWQAAKTDGKTMYKVWLDDKTKGLVMLTVADFELVFNTVRGSQYEAYGWYNEMSAKIKTAQSVQEMEQYLGGVSNA